MQIANSPTLNNSQDSALQNLQTAIVRLADKQSLQLASEKRIEYRNLVENALEAYREYMKVRVND